MTWQECFEKYHYYALIMKNNEAKRSLDIGMFLEEGEIPSELKQIYISKKQDEMFMIFQPKPGTDIQKFCSHWDSRIMSYINFGFQANDCHEMVEKLRYSITQILFYGVDNVSYVIKPGNSPLMECPTSFSEEKSVFVSRKILIPCEENDALEIGSRILLPFWYDELEEVKLNSDKEQELIALLPKIGMEVCLNKEPVKIDRRTKKTTTEVMNFSAEEFEAVKGWLEQ